MWKLLENLSEAWHPEDLRAHAPAQAHRKAKQCTNSERMLSGAVIATLPLSRATAHLYDGLPSNNGVSMNRGWMWRLSGWQTFEFAQNQKELLLKRRDGSWGIRGMACCVVESMGNGAQRMQVSVLLCVGRLGKHNTALASRRCIHRMKVRWSCMMQGGCGLMQRQTPPFGSPGVLQVVPV
jgi:hypothetical protein